MIVLLTLLASLMFGRPRWFATMNNALGVVAVTAGIWIWMSAGWKKFRDWRR